MKRLLLVALALAGCTRESIVYVNVPTPVETPTPAPLAECRFPQGLNYYTVAGVPELHDRLNSAMSAVLECPVWSECAYPTYDPQSFFYQLGIKLRSDGLCAGQPEDGKSDEIAVGFTKDKFEVYHAWNYNGKPIWGKPRSTPCVGLACGNPYRGVAIPR